MMRSEIYQKDGEHLAHGQLLLRKHCRCCCYHRADELLLWDDAPMPESYTREKVVTSVIETLAKHRD